MRRRTRELFIAALVVGVFCLTANVWAAAGFKKFEDFESYPLGPFVSNDKFSMNGNCVDVADVNIVNVNGSNQVEFDYKLTTPDSSCYLNIVKCPERITGIKADITVASCAAGQDCRARIAWHRGIHPPTQKYMWEAVQLRPNNRGDDMGNISLSVTSLDQSNNYDYIQDFYYNQLFSPIQTIGQTYTVTAIFDKANAVTIAVDGQGTTTTKFPGKLDNPIEVFKAIGMRVGTSGITNGDFVVYFDNIKVKTKGACDKKKPLAKTIIPKKNLNVDQCSVDINFNEPMADWSYDLEPPAEWGGLDTLNSYWSENRKTFTATRLSCGTPLPPNTKLIFVINPNGTTTMDYFRDLVGNPAKTMKVTTKTAP